VSGGDFDAREDHIEVDNMHVGSMQSLLMMRNPSNPYTSGRL